MVSEIGILLYPGVQMSAVLGLTDLFLIADGITGQTPAAPRLCLRHLSVEGGVPRQVYSTDDAPKGTNRHDVLILPPSLSPPIDPKSAAPVASWLRARRRGQRAGLGLRRRFPSG